MNPSIRHSPRSWPRFPCWPCTRRCRSIPRSGPRRMRPASACGFSSRTACSIDRLLFSRPAGVDLSHCVPRLGDRPMDPQRLQPWRGHAGAGAVCLRSHRHRARPLREKRRPGHVVLFPGRDCVVRVSDPSRLRRLALAGVALGLAVATKFSALFLLPVMVILYAIRWLAGHEQKGLSPRHGIGSVLAAMALAAAVVFLVYGAFWRGVTG
jgi:hypothetical protein